MPLRRDSLHSFATLQSDYKELLRNLSDIPSSTYIEVCAQRTTVSELSRSGSVTDFLMDSYIELPFDKLWDGGAWPALLGALRNMSVRLAPETDAKVRR